MTGLRQRQPRVECRAFLAFVREHRCCACGAASPSQAAHIRGASARYDKRQTGKGEKPSDRWSIPLCARCHLNAPDALHRVGEMEFFRHLGDPFNMANLLWNTFVSERTGLRGSPPPTQRRRKPDRRKLAKSSKLKIPSRPFPPGRKFQTRRTK